MTRQDQERKAFLDAIAADPDDEVTRLIFADWLTENGYDEEAESRRTWTPKKKEAEKFLIQFAKDYDLFEGYMGALSAGHTQYFHGNGGDDAMDRFRRDSDLVTEFWEAWSLVTGSGIPYDRIDDDYSGYPRNFVCGC